MIALRARIVVPIDSPPIADGTVLVDDGRIVAVSRTGDVAVPNRAKRVDLGDSILMPGLINLHCHLDYTVMRGGILSTPSFSGWVRRLNDLKRTLDDDDYVASIEDGFKELQTWGTTSVANIESFPELMVRMKRPPIRTWWFYELLDIRSRVHTEDVVAGALSFFDKHASWLGGFGLSPHAPYTTSVDLYRLARFCCEKYSMPFTTHLAESDEEIEMFQVGEGRLFEFLKALGRDMRDCGGRSPVRVLAEADALPRGSILAHLNHLAPADDEVLRGRGYHVAHCPNCHAYFGRSPFPFERVRDLGLPVSLGTDSCASNSGLNLFSEMRAFARAFPGVAPREIVRMVTTNPAHALEQSGKLGTIQPGAHADLIAIPCADGDADVFDTILANAIPPQFRMITGENR